MNIDLYLTPEPFNRVNLDNKTVAIIDVLRFGTSACAALRAGARGVIPTVGPGEAVEMWTKLGGKMVVLAGERRGIRIENFPLGNSPKEFTAKSVGGRLVVMTTTNGSGLFSRTRNARLVLCCGLVNVSRAAACIASTDRGLVVVCSGREGGFSIEDTICGGMLIHLLTTEHSKEITLNDAGSLALLLYQTNRETIEQTIRQGEHGLFLTDLGFAEDVEIAASIDAIPVLPVLREGRLVLGDNSRSL